MLLKQSVLPSICPKTNNEIDQLFEKIKKILNFFLIKEVQDKIEDFINKKI